MSDESLELEEVESGSVGGDEEICSVSLEEENGKDDDALEEQEVRRHWTLRVHCDALLFPDVYPKLEFSSNMVTYLWNIQRAAFRPSQTFIRRLSQAAGYTLTKIALEQSQIQQFVFCDSLLDIDWLDHASRKSFLKTTVYYLSWQTNLSIVCFDNIHVKRKEGMELLMALGCGSGKSLKQLYMWQMFHHDENPVLLDTTFCKYRDKGSFKASSTCKLSFWRSLLRFHHLTTLAINYGYLADVNGHTLVTLASVLTGRLKELQLLCLEKDSPHPSHANDFDGRFKIPDLSWKIAIQYCPMLKVHMAFVAQPLYENVTAFLSPSIPLSKFYLSSGIQIRHIAREFHGDCIMKTIIHLYSQKLELLDIHLWHNRELLDGILLKVLDNMVFLSEFKFCGILYRKTTMDIICQKIRDGYYLHLKRIRIRLQHLGDPPSHFENSDKVQDSLMNDMQTIAHKYKQVFKERGVEMDLGTFPV